MKTPEKRRHLPAELDALIDAEPASDAARLREVWDYAEAPPLDDEPSDVRLTKVWNAIEEKIDAPLEAPVHRSTHVSQRAPARVVPMRWMAAAAAVLVGAIGLGYWLKPVETKAPMGELVRLELEDGTRVELNSGAVIRHTRTFGDERRVFLEGEAFFDVAHDSRPFVVETFNANVAVLGTSFNVRAWNEGADSETAVALQTGSIQLAHTKQTAVPVILEPGHTAVVTPAGIERASPDTVLTNGAIAWRNGDFFFSNARLGTILDDVSRRYATRIQVADSALRGKRMKFSLSEPGSAEAVLVEICGGLELKYREVAGGFEIFQP